MHLHVHARVFKSLHYASGLIEQLSFRTPEGADVRVVGVQRYLEQPMD